jgi:hypothetical protein
MIAGQKYFVSTLIRPYILLPTSNSGMRERVFACVMLLFLSNEEINFWNKSILGNQSKESVCIPCLEPCIGVFFTLFDMFLGCEIEEPKEMEYLFDGFCSLYYPREDKLYPVFTDKDSKSLKFNLLFVNNDINRSFHSETTTIHTSNDSRVIDIHLCMKIDGHYYVLDHLCIDRLVKPDISQNPPSASICFSNLYIRYYNTDQKVSQESVIVLLNKSIDKMMSTLGKNKKNILEFSQVHIDLDSKYKNYMDFINGLFPMKSDDMLTPIKAYSNA